MRNAHTLSTGLSPDSTLFGPPQPDSVARWLYVPGDLEGSLMARMKQDAIRACNRVFHPGAFRRPHLGVLFAHAFELTAVPATFPITLWHSGNLRFDLNKTNCLRSDATPHPRPVSVDLAPFLRTGKNQIHINVFTLSEPATVLIDSAALRTGAAWTCNPNFLIDGPVAAFPAGGTLLFPHHETLPRTRLHAVANKDGIADFGCILLGRPDVQAELYRGLGESPLEASTAPTAEQRPLAEDNRDRGFQYVAVSDSARFPGGVPAEVSAHPARYAGAFACSDPELTKIWLHAAATLRVCMRELTVDGLKRDRLPWAGDAHVATVGNAVAFGEHGCIQRTLAALAPEDPAISPANGIIDYDLHWLISISAQWLFSGDTPFVRMLWPQVEAVIAALATREDEQGMLRHDGTWLFIDWIEFDKTQRCAALQALYVSALRAVATLATALDRKEFGARVSQRLARLTATVQRVFWSSATDSAALPAARHAGFLSELAGLVPSPASGEWPGPPATTPFMRYFECVARARRGHTGAMLDELRGYWGGMLRAGASTFWEGYDPAAVGAAHFGFYERPFGKSLCHAWSCGPLPLLSLELAGLRPADAGWSRVSCRPHAIPLDWACATIPTPLGDFRWEYEQGTLTLRIPDSITLDAPDAVRDGDLWLLKTR